MNYSRNKKSNYEYKYFKRLVTRILVSIILVLSIGILIKTNSENSYYIQKYLFSDSFKFTKVKKIYEDSIGKLLPDVSNNSKTVFKSTDFLNYPKENYEDGVKITIDKNDFVSSLNSGLVVYIGNKDKYDNTVIIQGNDGIDYWYGNIENINVNLYDYIKKDTIIGNPKDNYIYIVLKNGNDVLNYDEFIKKNKN